MSGAPVPGETAGGTRSRADRLLGGLRRRARLIGQAFSAPAPRPAPEPKAVDYVAPGTPRLVPSPVFVLSSVRSGSTLLRVLLNSHPAIRAPHEMHLRSLGVNYEYSFTGPAMEALELDRTQLQYLLWDRVLHLELARSGKQLIVDKTPANTLVWPRLRECWPDARFVVLLRHPAAVVTSLVNRRTDPDLDQIRQEVLGYAEMLRRAQEELDGHVVRYEELTAEPASVTRDLCEFLDVPWEPEMLDYGRHDHGSFMPQLGDWSSTLKSGRVQAARTVDDHPELPHRLVEIGESWGYEMSPRVAGGR